ncbi:hypothetical protein OEZ85_010538 [Tetradesmus obliquus]|uniref:J domain-containing protein n=1 Tax=Tetradesmus obliquus TaxID=3088 RepID=A0ABY8TML0_TETOB|nr:hypothetical protein OEZ85_010538 [Tetradesmus obliquus]
MDLLRRKVRPELKPPDTLSRYVVTKHAWYKHYKRIFLVTPTAIHTQNPERTLVLTNSYTFAGDSDIESVSLGTDEFEFVISARQDKKGKFKPLKFTCKHRQLLLTDLFQCMAAASAMGRCLVAAKVLGPSHELPAAKWSRSSSGWVPVMLRVTAFGLEALDPQSKAVRWRCDYQRMSSPGVMLLSPYQPAAGAAAPTVAATAAAAAAKPAVVAPQDGVFAVMARTGRSSPRVFALRNRDAMLGQLQQAARQKMAMSINIDNSGRSSLQELLDAVMLAERASSSGPGELPLGQWEVEALRGRADLLPPQLLQASPAQSARKLSVEALAGMTDVLVMSGANTVSRRLVVTPTSVITRRADSHDVVARRPLSAIAALVRFADDPKLLAVEWEDGVPPSQFVTPARDAVLAALLGAAQAAAGRPIAVMPGFTCPGDVIITDHKHASHAPATEPEPELARMYLAELNGRGREVAPALSGSSMMFYQSHISFSSSPRSSRGNIDGTPATAAAALASSPSSSSSSLGSNATSQPPAGSMAAAAAAAAKLANSFQSSSSSSHAKHAAAGGGEQLTPQDAANLMLECVYEFNACVPYAGVSLVAGEGCELDPQAIAAVLALLPEELQPGLPAPVLAPDDVKQAVAVLHCLQRLASNPHMAEQVMAAPAALARVWACLACGSDHVVAEAGRLLVRLMAPAPARHGAPPWRLLRAAAPLGSEDIFLTNSREDNATARTAKQLALPPSLAAERLAVLLQPLAGENVSALTSMALLEVVAAIAVDPGARTTDTSLQDACLRAAAALGRPLFGLFAHPAARVADGAAVLMRAIAECGAAAAAPMRDAALREGSLLHHLQLALFAAGEKAQLSQELVASWADEHAPALALLRRIFPPGLQQQSVGQPMDLARPAPALPQVAVGGLRGNWPAFWAAAAKDHCHAGLIWNESTRRELRDALDREVAGLRAARTRVAKGGGGWPSWNWGEFSVAYPSTASQLCIGGVYVRLLLEGGDPTAANGYLLMDHGGLQLLVDFVAGAHECTERRLAAAAAAGAGGAAAGAGHLITSISHAEAPKEWCFYPHGYSPDPQQHATASPAATSSTEAEAQIDPAADASGTDTSSPSKQQQQRPEFYQVGEEKVPGPDESGRAGPLSKEALRQLHSRGVITHDTWVWAPGMQGPARLSAVRELRWMCCGGLGLLGPFEAALVALQILQQLASLQPAVDESGAVLQPLPRAHVGLAAPSCLPHIAQAILTGEPALVSAAASLLTCILAHNAAALSRLYLSGAFLFGLAYCGSNLEELAGLFKAAHLVQGFRGAAEVTAGLPLVQRSYLGVLLPESLLHMLESYGPGVFAAALAGDHATPEIIWTAGMRQQRLIPAMLQHLGDFPHRLAQHCHAVYEYTPPPPLAWPELADEIWCHRYYLGNLCDEERFRGWPVVEHIPLLQALMEQWRAELARQPLAMSETQACEALGLSPGPDGVVSEDDMRRAYRALARRYHPDKNPSPEARAKFLQVQKAYERLQAGAAGGQGPQAWRLLLMLRAQCILFRRYGAVLAPYKYAGYPQLLEVLRQQQAASTAAAGKANAAAAAAGSPASGDAAGGAAAPAADGSGNSSSSSAAAAPGGHFLSGERVGQVLAAIELCWLTCVASKRNAEELMRSGGLPLLAGLLSRCVGILSMDVAPTAPEAVITSHTLRTLAGLAAVDAARREMEKQRQLLADIVKCCELSRAPAAVDAALMAICHMAASPALQQLLLEVGALPYLIPLLLEYDVTLSPETSARLQLPFSGPAGVSSSAGAAAGQGQQVGGGLEGGFKLLDSALVRPNMQEARSQHALLAAQALARLAGLLREPHHTPANAAAASALAALLTQSLAGRLAEPDPRPLLLCLNSSMETAQVIWNSGMREELSKVLAGQRSHGSDLAALQSFSFSSLAGELQETVTDEALLRQLFWLAVQPPSARVLGAALGLLRRLSASPLAASVGGYQGGAVLLLSVLLHNGSWPWPGSDAATAEAEGAAAKAAAADVLSALLAQPTHGPRVSLLLHKLLPPGLVATIAEGPPDAVMRALGQSVETPECMWDARMAGQAAAEVAQLAAAIRKQHAAHSFDWSPPASYQLQYDSLRGEVYVGGVYVRLFLKNPKYAVRDPVQFAEALVERYLQELTAATAGAYRDQRHDMFLPSGATAESGVVALLTAGDTARFALPAPESVQGGVS